ncbi:hypothetical protein B0J18DRAFT_456231 [Chaetomium sp. MPI-SDFR-AT-0129]|nr:hypothetical protein B0J18DRAFT_456231 [Chaetomium sp. MPI-SDFR-AT-0129]
MAAPPPQPPARSGMSLYANLLDADGSASISRDPVRFKDDKSDVPARKAIDPALRFQPIRRPQLTKPSAKPKPAFPKPPSAASIPSTGTGTTTSIPPAPPPPTDDPPPAPIPQPRATLADWAADDDNDYAAATAANAAEKRQRGGRRNKNKKNRKSEGGYARETDWDELYDPARPTNVEEYLRSEERVREVREWRGVLYARRWREEDEEGEREGGVRGRSGSDGEEGSGRGLGNQFAPPASFNFAPPPMSPPRAAAAAVPDDATGDDAYARRLALSGMTQPPPPPTDGDTSTISRAPIRYTQPLNSGPDNDNDNDAMDIDIDTNNPTPEAGEGESSSSRPGQQGFAQRLMAKYGWTKGSGLGASSTGITTALRVQVEKRKRRPDAEGGGFVSGGSARGRVIAPKSKSQAHSQSNAAASESGSSGNGKFGPTSVVIVLDHMLDNMPDLEAEVEDAGLGQEIGEECGERYGRVERLVVDIEGRRVLIRFVEAVSALRAVNALEGRVFNGNTIVARFYDEEKFEEGIYDG